MDDTELTSLIRQCRDFADMCGTVPFIGTAKELLYQAADTLELLQKERTQIVQPRSRDMVHDADISPENTGTEFDIKITKVLEGHVKMKAESPAAALAAAENLYIKEGRELPDMEEPYPLQIRIAPPYIAKEKPPISTGEHPSPEEVEYYLIQQGYPQPSADLTGEFMNGGEKQPMYDEAVRNGYCMADLDRWLQLNSLMSEPVSFRAAMMIEDALWEEDCELLECNSLKDLLETANQVCRDRIAFVIDVYKQDGTIVPNEWDITDQDVMALANAFEAVLTATPAQKRSLSSIIESADSKAFPADTPTKSGPTLPDCYDRN
ncbi:MAG: hypothetical protein IIX70_02530 [Oscillospiraceae bacterium]|nr:hypothetical protein [Oscillospiraceae bacterium]